MKNTNLVIAQASFSSKFYDNWKNKLAYNLIVVIWPARELRLRENVYVFWKALNKIQCQLWAAYFRHVV